METDMTDTKKAFRVRRMVDYCETREKWRFLKTWDVSGNYPFGAYGLEASQAFFGTKAQAAAALDADRARRTVAA